MISNVNCDESRKLPHPQGDFRPIMIASVCGN
jgi:hypothetical protein